MLRSLILLFTFVPAVALAGKVPLDLKNSSVKWRGSKAFVGDFHTGTVNISGGHIMMEGDKVTGGEVVIDMSSIKNTDLTDPKMNGKLVEHLKSADFFDVPNHKEAKFVITSVKPVQENDYAVEGELTVRGKPQTMKVFMEIKRDKRVMVAKGKADFDRTKHGVMYNSKGAFPNLLKTGKDKVIKDQIELEMHLVSENI